MLVNDLVLALKDQVSIPSAEAGGVRLNHIQMSFLAAAYPAFQSPPPKRGACDAFVFTTGFNYDAVVSIPSAEAGGVRQANDLKGRPTEIWYVSIPSAEAGGVRPPR